jgi:transposase
MESILLSTQDQRRTEVLTKLLSGDLDRPQACQLLSVSDRTLTRLRTCFVAGGAAALVHGNRGRVPVNKISDAVIARLQDLAAPKEGIYKDFNVCHMQEMLARADDVFITRSTLDRVLKEQGLRVLGRKHTRRVFSRRERMAQAGMMLQLDGSQHDWLEKRGPRLCLMGAIDDATNEVVYLRFHLQETQEGYIRMIRQITVTFGLPTSVYHDKHTILRSPKAATLEDELAGREPMSQVQRLLSELGIESIAASTPQAKGRIERLWGTLQDRLPREMRLAGITTMEQANAFLELFLKTFNAKFSRAAADPQAAWVQAEGLDLSYYFCVKEQRTVRKDHTLCLGGKILQLTPISAITGKKLNVHQTPEGEIFVYDGKKQLPHHMITAQKAMVEVPEIPIPADQAPPLPIILDQGRNVKQTRTPGQLRWLYGQEKSTPPQRRLGQNR